MSNRLKRHKRIRKKVCGTASRPRLSVYRSNKMVYCQLIDDERRVTLLGMSTSFLNGRNMTKTEKAKELGLVMGKKIKDSNICTKIVFDRGGYKYHGRVKAVAEGLRESGLEF